MLGGFCAPFLLGIEVKVAFGRRTTRFRNDANRNGIYRDIQKLGEFLHQGKIEHGCVVVMDFFAGREMLSDVNEAALTHGVQLCYASLS
jgi:hypothetical protein